MKYFLFSLQGRTDKSVGFSHLQQRSSKDVASYCVQLLPALCSHLENCHNHFQVKTPAIAGFLFSCLFAHFQFVWKFRKVLKISFTGFKQDWSENITTKCNVSQFELCSCYFLCTTTGLKLRSSAAMSEIFSFFQLSMKKKVCIFFFIHLWFFSPDTAVWEQRHGGWTCHRCSWAWADVIRLPAAPAGPEHHLQLVSLTQRDVVCLWTCLWPLLSFVPGMCLSMCVYLSGLDSASQDSGAYWRRLWEFLLDD